MRYTRYNYRRKNNNRKNNRNNMGFLLLGGICILLAVVVGTVLRPLIFGDAYKNSTESDKPKVTEEGSKENVDKPKDDKETGTKPEENKETDKDKTVTNENKNIYMIQCGLYSKKDGAETIVKKIPENFNKFISEEDGKFRVIAGIYDSEASKTKSEELKKQNIDNVRIKSEFKAKEETSMALYTILKGFTDILNKLEENDVKSINTEEFKTWTNKLETENDNEELKSIKKHINELPKDLDKKQAQKSLDYIYKILIKHRV